MSLVVEFVLPADAVALDSTLSRLPGVSVELEQRVWDAAAELAPHVWVTGESVDQFGPAARDDPSVTGVRRIERFEDGTLFRLRLAGPETGFLTMVGAVDAVLLGASASGGYWTLEVRFNDREALSRFQRCCREADISYEVTRMSELSYPADSRRGDDLTPKQYEALAVAYTMGYFRHPRDATLEEIACQLGISRQALSRRLRRGQQQLFARTFGEESTDPLEG